MNEINCHVEHIEQLTFVPHLIVRQIEKGYEIEYGDANLQSSQEKRNYLIDHLQSESGCRVILIGDKASVNVIYKLETQKPVNKLPNRFDINIFSGNGDPIGWTGCNVTGNFLSKKTKVGKGYDSLIDQSQFSSLGVMKVSFSMLSEVMRHFTKLKRLDGFIRKENLSSIFSRLRAPDLTKGGFLHHEIYESNPFDYRLSTFINRRDSLGKTDIEGIESTVKS